MSCNGLLDGYAAIGNISGGNGGLTYSWDATAGSQTTDTATNLAAGTYIVTVTDSKGVLKDADIGVATRFTFNYYYQSRQRKL